jgi:hypothetical protein
MFFVPPGIVGQWGIVPGWGKWSILGDFWYWCSLKLNNFVGHFPALGASVRRCAEVVATPRTQATDSFADVGQYRPNAEVVHYGADDCDENSKHDQLPYFISEKWMMGQRDGWDLICHYEPEDSRE